MPLEIIECPLTLKGKICIYHIYDLYFISSILHVRSWVGCLSLHSGHFLTSFLQVVGVGPLNQVLSSFWYSLGTGLNRTIFYHYSQVYIIEELANFALCVGLVPSLSFLTSSGQSSTYCWLLGMTGSDPLTPRWWSSDDYTWKAYIKSPILLNCFLNPHTQLGPGFLLVQLVLAKIYVSDLNGTHLHRQVSNIVVSLPVGHTASQ